MLDMKTFCSVVYSLIKAIFSDVHRVFTCSKTDLKRDKVRGTNRTVLFNVAL